MQRAERTSIERAWLKGIRRRGPLIAIASSVLLALALVAPTVAATQEVTIAGFAFSPAELTVGDGVSVTWTNADGVAHTVTADDGSFDSGTLSSGGTFSHTFTAGGTFAYHCSIHSSMTGTIVVEGATSPPTSTLEPTPSSGPSPVGPIVVLVAALVGLLVLRRRLLEG